MHRKEKFKYPNWALHGARRRKNEAEEKVRFHFFRSFHPFHPSFYDAGAEEPLASVPAAASASWRLFQSTKESRTTGQAPSSS